MNKDLLINLSYNELLENKNRLEIANEQLLDLFQSLEDEQRELTMTKEMLLKTLMEIAPRETMMNRVFNIAKDMWSGFWKKDTASEDKEEWNKIMKELE